MQVLIFPLRCPECRSSNVLLPSYRLAASGREIDVDSMHTLCAGNQIHQNHASKGREDLSFRGPREPQMTLKGTETLDLSPNASNAAGHCRMPCGGLLLRKRKEKLRRQRKLSLHQLRKRRHIGSKEPWIPSTTKLQKEGSNGDLEGYWKHPAP
eukprot:1156818-Pelagomonas_calceolata.AAC.1